MVDSWRLFRMAVWRNFTILARYKLNLLFEILGAAMWGLVQAFLLRVITFFDTDKLQAMVGSSNIAAIGVLGASFLMLQNIATFSGGEMLREELSTGQIDYTFSSPLSRYTYTVVNIAAIAVRTSVFFLPVFLVGLWASLDTLTLVGILLGLLAVAGTLACLCQIGTIFAALVLRFQQVSAFYMLYGFVTLFLSGMGVPLQVLPLPLRLVGFVFLPQSVGIDLLRHYVMNTRTLLPAPLEWLFMLGQYLALAWLARNIVSGLERAARERGLHYV